MVTLLNCVGVSSQSAPDPPTNVQILRMGAREMEIRWTHSGDFGGDGFLFRPTMESFLVFIRSLSESPDTNVQFTVDYRERTLDVDGLTPYRYFSSNGVRFSVQIAASSNFGSSFTTRETFLPSEQVALLAFCACQFFEKVS